jgi:hypothetical protein
VASERCLRSVLGRARGYKAGSGSDCQRPLSLPTDNEYANRLSNWKRGVNVRGLGLMIGVELVKDQKLIPATTEAEAIRDALLRNGVLVGVGGIYGNVIRFQPPNHHAPADRSSHQRIRGSVTGSEASRSSVRPASYEAIGCGDRAHASQKGILRARIRQVGQPF